MLLAHIRAHTPIVAGCSPAVQAEAKAARAALMAGKSGEFGKWRAQAQGSMAEHVRARVGALQGAKAAAEAAAAAAAAEAAAAAAAAHPAGATPPGVPVK